MEEYRTTKKKKFSLHNVILAVVFFVFGYLSFSSLQEIRYKYADEQNLDLFWYVYSTLDSKYPFEQPNDADKMYGAIQGLVDSYDDDYSSFLPPTENEFFNQTISGEFGGIGAEIGVRSGYLSIITPLKDSPAERAGLLPGDLITYVDGIDIAGRSLDRAISFIRGEVGTDVTLTVIRLEEEEPLEITVTRDTVTIPVIDTEIIEDVFVIHLYNFNETSEKRFEEAIREFKNSGATKLLLDLRNNPGGLLISAVDMASYFLPQGTIVLKEKRGVEDEDEVLYRSTGKDLLSELNYEVIVLINNGSASAAEILAGALQDNETAIVAGETSFGKGSVQELLQLPQNTALKVTVAKWLTPLGNEISEVGIQPDVIIESDRLDQANDVQLLRAVRLFNQE